MPRSFDPHVEMIIENLAYNLYSPYEGKSLMSIQGVTTVWNLGDFPTPGVRYHSNHMGYRPLIFSEYCGTVQHSYMYNRCVLEE